MLNKAMLKQATGKSDWDFGNQVLYDLCRTYPFHNDKGHVTAKIWLIGRSYAAAIERRKENTSTENDDFYLDVVTPTIIKSPIDDWFNQLRNIESITPATITTILSVHRKVTDLFYNISKMNKRSLASKYLHFHFPNLFYIYDSRACNGLSKLKGFCKYKQLTYNSTCADKEYSKLFLKCQALKNHIHEHYQQTLSPREIDKLLLEIVSISIGA